MKKEIQIAAKLNFEDFDKAVGDLQRKLKDLYAPSNAALAQMQMNQRLGPLGLGSGAASSPAAQAAYQRQTQQVRRETDQAIANEVRGQEKLAKLIAQRGDKLKEMQMRQQAMIKGTEEELALREKIARVQENNARMMEQFKSKDATINQLVEARERMKPQGWDRLATAYKNGGISGVATAGGRMFGGLGAAQKIESVGAILGLLTTGVAGASSAYKYFGQAPIDAYAGMGNAVSGTFGREIGNAYSGRSALEASFLPEKATAARMAMENNRRLRNASWVDAGVGIMGNTVAGTVGGAMVGGVPGAVIGGLGGLTRGIYNNAQTLASPFSTTANNAREAEFAKKFAEDFASALEGQKAMNPLKTMAAEDYGQNYIQNLNFQRSTGMFNQQFHGPGGFRESAINAGFGDRLAMEQSSAILGAGGSTRMAQDPIVALQAARNYNVTNASNVLGNLSGSIGNSEASKKAFIEMIAEGQRIGLDSSQFAEENRRFLDTTSQIINQSGATGGSDVDRITKRFGGFVGEDLTNKGIQSAQTAYQAYNTNASQTAGPRGVLRFSALKSDPVLGKLSGQDQIALMGIKDDQLTSDDPIIQSISDKLGIEPEDLVARMHGVNEKGSNLMGSTDKYRDQLKNLSSQLKNETDPTKQAQIQKQMRSTLGRLNENLQRENPGLSVRERRSMAQGEFGGTPNLITGGTTAGDIFSGLQNRETGRVEDTTVQANAESSRLVLDNFNQMKDTLVATAEQIKAFNATLEDTIRIAQKLPEAERNKVMSSFNSIFNPSQTQPQGTGKGGR